MAWLVELLVGPVGEQDNLAGLSELSLERQLGLRTRILRAVPARSTQRGRVEDADAELEAGEHRGRVDHRSPEPATQDAETDHALRGTLRVDGVRKPDAPPVRVENVDVGRATRGQGPGSAGEEAAPRALQLRVSLSHVGNVRIGLVPELALDVRPDLDVARQRGPLGDLVPHPHTQQVPDEPAAEAHHVDGSLGITALSRLRRRWPKPPVDGLGRAVDHLGSDRRAVAVDIAQEGADPTVRVDLPVVTLEDNLLGEGAPRNQNHRQKRKKASNLQAGAERPRSR